MVSIDSKNYVIKEGENDLFMGGAEPRLMPVPSAGGGFIPSAPTGGTLSKMTGQGQSS